MKQKITISALSIILAISLIMNYLLSNKINSLEIDLENHSIDRNELIENKLNIEYDKDDLEDEIRKLKNENYNLESEKSNLEYDISNLENDVRKLKNKLEDCRN